MLRDATTYAWQGERRNLLMGPEQHGARWCATVHWNQPHTPFALPDDDAVHPLLTTKARVERGAWIVDCPCGGAQFACRTDRRMFCPDCLNKSGADGKWVIVEWPDDRTVGVVEALLEFRPTDTQRNWYPDRETTDDLAAENTANGWIGVKV